MSNVDDSYSRLAFLIIITITIFSLILDSIIALPPNRLFHLILPFVDLDMQMGNVEFEIEN